MLPWFENEKQQHHRPSDWPLSNCASCLKTQSKLSRQSWACGYELPAPAFLPVRPWDHAGRKPGPSEYDEDGEPSLQICAGYVCSLPEVHETARARVHAKDGNLSAFCGKGPPHDRLLESLEILESSVGAYQRWDLNKDKKE